jgi:hypothetical protein
MATIGDTSAPSTNTVYYDALLSTTLDAYVGSGSLFDNIFKDSAFLAALRSMGGIQKQNGGERIRAPLMYGKNNTVSSYSDYDVLDTTPQDGITTAFYEWAELGGTISISRKEERQNSGEAAIISLLESKIMQAEMSMREELNTQLIQGTVSGATFIPGNSAKDLNPLGWFLRKANATNPTAGGNVGIALRRMYNYCCRGSGGSPNLVLFDQVTYETYENALDDKVRYSNTTLADMGFDNIKLRGATCIWDEVVPDIDNGTTAITDGTAFFLNTNFYKLIIDSETDVVTTPFVEPENQTAKTAKILFMGNATCSNLRKQGVLYATSQSIVA